MAAHFDDTVNTPRHRFDPTGVADIPRCDWRFTGPASDRVGVTCEFWEDWPGLAEFIPNDNWSADKIARLKRSIYFTHLPNDLTDEEIKGIFGHLGVVEAIEVHKHPDSNWALGFVRFKDVLSADNAMRTEVSIEINEDRAAVIGYGAFVCVVDIEDGFKVVENSVYFLVNDE